MVTTPKRVPNYFLVVFGIGFPEHPVEGGFYGIKGGFVEGSGVSAGDVLLLYENLGFQGIGIVTSTQNAGEGEGVYYQYFPLCHPVSWDSLDAVRRTIPELRIPLNYKGNWLQKISNTSFRAAIAGRQIDWP